MESVASAHQEVILKRSEQEGVSDLAEKPMPRSGERQGHCSLEGQWRGPCDGNGTEMKEDSGGMA